MFKHVREAQAADCDYILACAKDFHAEDGHQLTSQGALALEKAILADDETARFCTVFVAIHEGRAIGYLVISYYYSIEWGGLIATLDDIYLEPEKRGLGLGKAIMGELGLFLKTKGIGVIQLEVMGENTRAKAFYQDCGFKCTGRDLMLWVM